MGIIDQIKAKSQDIMNDPAKREKVEQIAREKGLSIEEAKAYFLKNNQG